MSTKCLCAMLSVLLICLSLAACAKEPPKPLGTNPTQSGKPILPSYTVPSTSPNDYTAVYVTVFEDLAILASYPVMEYEGKEPECSPRELTNGCGILCGGEHEDQVPITRVVITGELVPRAMNGWFRDMVHLAQIDGLEKIRTHNVTDMSGLFAGCERLSQINVDGWDVSNVADMTGMFDNCRALAEIPDWYEPNS